MWRPIFLKELVEVFGDSRTRFNVIFGPLIITPLLLAMIGTLARSQAAEAHRREIAVGIVGLQSAPAVAAELQDYQAKGIEFVFLPSIEEAERQVRSRKLPVGLAVAGDADKRMSSNGSASLTLIVDSGNESSGQAADRLREYL